MNEKLKTIKGRIESKVGEDLCLVSDDGQRFEGKIGYVSDCIEKGRHLEITYRISDNQIVAYTLP